MTQAYIAQSTLNLTGFETRRIIENRSASLIGWGLRDVLQLAMLNMGLQGKAALAGTLSGISMVWGIAELGEVALYAILEHDWVGWIRDFSHGIMGWPKRLEVLYLSTDLGSPRLLGYFGMGDEHWIVPPDWKDEAELLVNPYGRAKPMKSLDFSNFLYDDHDVSAGSGIERQVLSSGGMAASSSGIVHDPYTIYFSGHYFDSLAAGKPIGEAMREAVNNIVPESPLTLFELFLSSGELPNLYFKTKYERLLFGDPAYMPVEEGLPERKPFFSVRPFRSYLAVAEINSSYSVKDGKVSVSNADDSLVQSGRPVVPVFVREIVLPEGSEIQDVRFEGLYRTQIGIAPDVVPWDEYYEGGPEGFEGRYPEEDFWYRTNTLVDGRILVRVYVPGVVYLEEVARILRHGTAYVEYEAPLEISVNASSIMLGQTENIVVSLYNQGEEALSGSLWLLVDGEEFSRDVGVGANETVEEVFSYVPGEAGLYQARVVYDSEIPAGPRYANFMVLKPKESSPRGFRHFFR